MKGKHQTSKLYTLKCFFQCENRIGERREQKGEHGMFSAGKMNNRKGEHEQVEHVYQLS